MMKHPHFLLIFALLLGGCSDDNDPQGPIGISQLPDDTPIENPPEETPSISDEELLDITQKETFKYFWDFAHETSGCARERYHPDDPSKR